MDGIWDRNSATEGVGEGLEGGMGSGPEGRGVVRTRVAEADWAPHHPYPRVQIRAPLADVCVGARKASRSTVRSSASSGHSAPGLTNRPPANAAAPVDSVTTSAKQSGPKRLCTMYKLALQLSILAGSSTARRFPTSAVAHISNVPVGARQQHQPSTLSRAGGGQKDTHQAASANTHAKHGAETGERGGHACFAASAAQSVRLAIHHPTGMIITVRYVHP